MKRYKDERLRSEMQEIQAKLFRYMISCFAVIYVFKFSVLKNYSNFEQGLDQFILFSTIIYAGYLEFKSKSDFYIPEKLPRIVIGAILVGFVVMLMPMKENNFQFDPVYMGIYLLTFLNGVLVYVIVFLITRVIKKWRHNKFENELEDE